MSVVSTGLRCCLYYTVSNPWYFLPIELLNGLSYSVFHSVMGAYASHIAPPGAQATVQSIFRSTFYTGEFRLCSLHFLQTIAISSFNSSLSWAMRGKVMSMYDDRGEHGWVSRRLALQDQGRLHCLPGGGRVRSDLRAFLCSPALPDQQILHPRQVLLLEPQLGAASDDPITCVAFCF